MRCNKKKFIILCFIVFLHAFASYADKDIEYLKRMFSKENVQSEASLLCADTKGIGIIEKAWHDYNGDKRLEIDKLMIDGMRSFAIPVDVDGKTCAYGSKIIDDRGFFFVNFLNDSELIRKEKDELVELVKYLGTVRISSMPTPLATRVISGDGFFENEEHYKAYTLERKKQFNSARINREITNYRQFVIMICAEAMPTWKKKMSEAEFKAFVAELEDLGNMNDLEKTILEQRVISEEERVKRVEAWFALPPEKRQ